MIITQTHKRRTFVGCLNAGTDVVDSLLSICVDNAIFCASFSAVGYLKDVSLRTFDPARRAYREPTQHPGMFHAVSLRGNVSLRERQTVVTVHAIGAREGAAGVLSGELVAGEVMLVEFELATQDDIRLYRAEDAKTGLEPWLHVEFGSGPPPRKEDNTVQLAPTAVVADAEPPPRERPKGMDHHELDIREGDLLLHPTLGRCQVTANDGDERMTIRLESGRTVELHLGLLELTPAAPEGRKRMFKVAIKRRRP
ncbi:MAG: DNA-binding protein [Myxococcales bacterium]|nr:DNA-binding protein [Myxococcales bacterium]MCB9736355.1 DNA-binding protein [Deltaproteobacteria bacterium]